MRPTPFIAGLTAYSVPRAAAPIDLHLDGNEGDTPSSQLLRSLSEMDPSRLRRYPDAGPLERRIADHLGARANQVIVTAGADDALDRCCRALLAPGREMISPVPGFSMLHRYARIAGGQVVEVSWPQGAYPTAEVIAEVNEATAIVVVTSPNNPTGAVATPDDLLRLSQAAPQALILVDLAYAEFADVDLLPTVLSLPNALATLTFSKAWGLAGLRVGYAVGAPHVVDWLRAAGQPYAVSSVSLHLAERRLAQGRGPLDRFVHRVHEERRQLTAALQALDAAPAPSQGNFVLATVPDALWLRDGMAGLGVGIRAFPGRTTLRDKVRISCPGGPVQFERLLRALNSVLRPEALLLDMDGVLADVSGSYRAAIIATAAHFGVSLHLEQIRTAKETGDANNDWVLTRRLLAETGVEVPLDEVTRVFEGLYQGTDDAPGLRHSERLLTSVETLSELSRRVPLAVVTGRPLADARWFLERQHIAHLFRVLVTMEDTVPKPDPAPVRLALSQLGVEHAWMVGDTVDDVRAARAAQVVPLGVEAPGDASAAALVAAGAGRVLQHLDELLELLP